MDQINTYNITKNLKMMYMFWLNEHVNGHEYGPGSPGTNNLALYSKKCSALHFLKK